MSETSNSHLTTSIVLGFETSALGIAVHLSLTTFENLKTILNQPSEDHLGPSRLPWRKDPSSVFLLKVLYLWV